MQPPFPYRRADQGTARQSSAVAAALDAFNRELLNSHIRTCVADDIRAGRNEKTDELIDILRKLMR